MELKKVTTQERVGLEIFCDFDGTITRSDTIDVLLETLADESWRSVEEQWIRGEIGSRECMTRQVGLIRGGWQAIVDVLSSIEIDPSFPRFVEWCRSCSIPVRIVSDGIDRVIDYFLQREGVGVDDIWANRLIVHEDQRLELGFPYSSLGCASGVCKCKVLEQGTAPCRVVIGDGRSDYCWSGSADLVFAKGSLLRQMRTNGRPCIDFSDFDQVRRALEEMADGSVQCIA